MDMIGEFLELEAESEDLGGYLHDGDDDGDGVETEGDTLMASSDAHLV